MRDAAERFVHSIRSSLMLRLLAVGFLALVLQIPVAMIGRLVAERQQRRDAAIGEVSSKWGEAQSLTGPALVVPYDHRWTETSADGRQIVRGEVRHAIFLPERLRLRGALDTDVRHRGIFSVPVYRLDLALEGEFAPPRPSDLGVDPASVHWERAQLALGISDARAIQGATTVSWNDRRVAFLPGAEGLVGDAPGIHAPVGLPDPTRRVTFSFPLLLNGSLRVDFVPFGENTVVELEGDHGHPSFQGNWLPTAHTISSDSFRAQWAISFLGRGYPQAWTSRSDSFRAVHASRFGVELVDPVDHYRMAARSVKYAGLFILLTFATVWLIEVLAGVRVHPIQYLLLGGALCLFYLLELSLSEHFGFPLAYVAASVAVVAMVGAYGLVALRSPPRALVVAIGVTLLYGYLYLLLLNEDYALLIGSLGLFAILAAIMYVTRRVDWYAVGPRAIERPSSSE